MNMSIYNIQLHFYNFRYGCTLCLVKGSYNGDYRKMLYPVEVEHESRSAAVFAIHQRRALPRMPLFGVKGPTELSNIITMPTSLAYDIMHLIYHGVAKSFLHAVLKRKMVDMEALSQMVELFKVPHDFRRKPRNLTTELSLWKSQEHRHFLLYIGPIAFFLLQTLRKSYSDLFETYYLLSVAIYALSSEQVSKYDLSHCKHLISRFQKMIACFFDASVCTMSTHALIHLPEQVEKMGPLTLTSASTFENLLRILKRSVTGAKGQPHQMLTRFYLSQSCATASTGDHVRPLGRLQNLDVRMQRFCSDFSVAATGHVKRFTANGKVFHAYNHGRRLKSASYFAYLKELDIFLKIKFIFVADNDIYCICRKLLKLRKLHCDPKFSFSADDLVSLDLLSSYFLLEKSDVVCHRSNLFTHHAIVYKFEEELFGVRVLSNWEHE